jgi:hypothetical protein
MVAPGSSQPGPARRQGNGPEHLRPTLFLTSIHPIAWKWNSRKSGGRILHSPAPIDPGSPSFATTHRPVTTKSGR